VVTIAFVISASLASEARGQKNTLHSMYNYESKDIRIPQ